jgi:hypothetical protein
VCLLGYFYAGELGGEVGVFAEVFCVVGEVAQAGEEVGRQEQHEGLGELAEELE